MAIFYICSANWGTVEASVCSVSCCGGILGQDKGVASWWHWIALQAAVSPVQSFGVGN